MQNSYKQVVKRLIKRCAEGAMVYSFGFAFALSPVTGQAEDVSRVRASFADALQEITVTGSVTSSEDGVTLPGVSVLVKGTSQGTTTDIDGRYTLRVPDGNAVLVFSFIGYETQEVAVAAQSVINVSMQPDVRQLDEVVVVGYGTQRKVTLTGAVATLKGSEMLQTKNENPQNMLTGRIPGVRVWQRSAEPGTYSNNFDIRAFGSPLVVIDGIPRTMEEFQRMNPNDIEDISALKDASAAIYGVRGANGVLLVTTKKGSKEGKTTVSYNGSYTWQKPSGLPMLADPFQTMTLYNERARNSIGSPSIIYQPEHFEEFRNGTRRVTDWNSLIFSDYSPQTQHDVSISGGGDKTQYHISAGYFFQEGFFKSGDLNYEKYNIRSNITSEIARGLNLNLNLSGIADQRNNPYSDAVDIIRNYWRQGVLFPAYADPENTMLNFEGLDLQENTVAKMTADVSGYRKYKQRYFQSSASLDYDLGTLTPALKGLSAKALLSFDYRQDDNSSYRREYYQYTYDKNTESYISELYNPSSPSRVNRSMYTKQQVLSQFILDYKRTFSDVHNVEALIGWETQRRAGDNFFSQRDLAFAIDYLLGGVEEGQRSGMGSGFNDLYEFAYLSTIGRVNYTFADKYIVEGQFRYDGSSRFHPDHRWGFFPSASLGWRISEESFFQSVNALSFVDQLKFRVSYGEMGDDFVNSSESPYQWLAGYTYPAVGGNSDKGYYNQYAPGSVFGGQFIYGVDRLPIPNERITWYTSRTVNVGIDFEGWNGLFGFSLDYFNRHRTGIFNRRLGEFPTVIGATPPEENVNSDRHFGLELALTHRNRIGELSYQVNGMATVTRNKHLVAVHKGPWGNSYDRWRNDNLNNRYQGVQFGYEAAGRYEDWDDIRSYPIYKERDILPGDYKYVDWNGDGEINGLDEHPFAFDQTPWMNFSLGFSGSYKNFDLNLLLQGSALGSMEYREPLYSIWGSNGGGTLTQYLDRWHTVDPLADPWDPETEWVKGYYGFTGNYPRSNSEFNRVSTDYLRLKSIEVGYTLPKLGASSFNVRVFANAYNMITWTGVRFVDPEHPDSDLGRLYPLNKTYTVGVSARF